MAEQENKIESPEDLLKKENPEEPVLNKKKQFLNPKIFLFGLPVFIIQLLIVYFVTANILLSKIEVSPVPDSTTVNAADPEPEQKKKPNPDIGKYVYSINDIIVNPADTDGKRLLLTSIGFDLATEKEKQNMEMREIVVKDIIISSLSSKGLEKLSSFAYRDTLKMEMSHKIKQKMPELKIKNVYFSKFIIQ